MVNQIVPIQLPLDFVINSRVGHSSLSGSQNHSQIWIGRNLCNTFNECRKHARWVKYLYAISFSFFIQNPKVFSHIWAFGTTGMLLDRCTAPELIQTNF